MRPLLILLLSSISSFAFAQDTTNVPFICFPEPQFPGGDSALVAFLQSNIKYPQFAMENSIQGKVVVGFVIDTNGSVTNVTIKKGVSLDLDKEAMRVVKLLPKFKPPIQQGKLISVPMVIPIMFKLAPFDLPKKK